MLYKQLNDVVATVTACLMDVLLFAADQLPMTTTRTNLVGGRRGGDVSRHILMTHPYTVGQIVILPMSTQVIDRYLPLVLSTYVPRPTYVSFKFFLLLKFVQALRTYWVSFRGHVPSEYVYYQY